jgi:hypothetical protein
MTLSKFESDLKKRMPTEYLRPFVCDGSPLACQVFVVGHNPATNFAKPFWDHWDSKSGFLRADFLRDFRLERNQPKKLKGARARLEKIVDLFTCGFGQNAILETNIYSEPTPSARQLREHDTRVFDFLLSTIGPKIVYLHGREAIQFFCPKLEFSGFEELRDITAFVEKPRFQLLATSHLRNMRLDKAAVIGADLAKHLVAKMAQPDDANVK